MFVTVGDGFVFVNWHPGFHPGLYRFVAVGDRLIVAIEKGVETTARARMTDDCKKGIAKFLEK